ncbi:MAG: peptidoglycan DD-metalloendopeptidase family protein [Armatimonadota bacterium]
MRRICYFVVFAFLLVTSSSLLFAQAGDKFYTPEEIRSKPAEYFLDRMMPPEAGYHQFAALQALEKKSKEGDTAGRRVIIDKASAIIRDTTKDHMYRWLCCYVLAGTGDVEAVPQLVSTLQDRQSGLSGFAAEALVTIYKETNSIAAINALRKAAVNDPSVREVLQRQLGETVTAGDQGSTPVSVSVEELAPYGPPQPPAGPKSPVAKPLPWPFPGDQKDQHIFNNYQQATDVYIHCGLDFIQPAGTPVTAVGAGYVAAIYTNYPEWGPTHYFFIVTPVKGGSKGWCYTHLDPRTFTFKIGDYIRQGQKLGSLVNFSVGKKPGVAHLHLQYVSFTKESSGKVNPHSLLDPLYFFDWKDTAPPTFMPLAFASEGTTQLLPADNTGTVTVSGKVDILAVLTDGGYPEQMGNIGVPVVMLSISDGTHTMQKLVLDHRGDVGNEMITKPLYLTAEERKVFCNPDSFPRYQVLRVTKTDGDGRITPKDASECWDTNARDKAGNPIWPDGLYTVNVYAWDIGGNRSVTGANVRVSN